MKDIRLVVSSFQAIAPGGFGLNSPVVSEGFDAFDVWSRNHLVTSHHLAHAMCALGASGFSEAAVLVCDLAGTTSLDGKDFTKPFTQWYCELEQAPMARVVKTECLSVYRAKDQQLTLEHRDYCVPHSKPDQFIFSVASLYENVARAVFLRDNAHGQLMALAAFGADQKETDWRIKLCDILEVKGTRILWKNNWQPQIHLTSENSPKAAALANVVQSATEQALLAHAKKAKLLTQANSLAVAGGIFLNINANSKIVASQLFQDVYVPSAPGDAGIAVGCALLGQQQLGIRLSSTPIVNDRIGPPYEDKEISSSLEARALVLRWSKVTAAELAKLLFDGAVVARWHGRSEFGPRALGGRSLLASPFLEAGKRRLNVIKGRQEWRPVAPIVKAEDFSKFFDGPPLSPFMSYLHVVKPTFQDALAALSHPDGSTRAQTLVPGVDLELEQTLGEFGVLSSIPVLVNTSLNEKNEPIIETPREAVDFYLDNRDVDYLVLDGTIVSRRRQWSHPAILSATISMNNATSMSASVTANSTVYRISIGAKSEEVSAALFKSVLALRSTATVSNALRELGGPSSGLSNELYGLVERGFLTCNGLSAASDA